MNRSDVEAQVQNGLAFSCWTRAYTPSNGMPSHAQLLTVASERTQYLRRFYEDMLRVQRLGHDGVSNEVLIHFKQPATQLVDKSPPVQCTPDHPEQSQSGSAESWPFGQPRQILTWQAQTILTWPT